MIPLGTNNSEIPNGGTETYCVKLKCDIVKRETDEQQPERILCNRDYGKARKSCGIKDNKSELAA